jgi:phage/plasmid-associated DNA primase
LYSELNNLNEKYDHPKTFNKICENSNISRSLSQIRVELTMADKPFKPDYFQLHFKNGYIDLKTLEFKQRIVGEDFIKNYINRDYEKTDEEKEKYFFNILRQIYPNEKDLETMLFILGSALTGKSTREQKILFLLGLGSSGKSTILSLTEKAIETYFQALEEDAFSNSNGASSIFTRL